MANKPSLSFWQIIHMNVGFLGIQYSFALQQNAVNPIYKYLGAENGDLPILQIAGPVTGLLVQPVIGALSDRTWSNKWGRRKPYFLIGAIMCSLGLLAFPFSSSLWMAVSLLWILDIANNTAMEPYRAFVADKLPEVQHSTGFLIQSFFTGLGQCLATLSIFIFPAISFFKQVNAHNIPYWVYASFFIGAIVSIGSVLWSMHTTPEIKPSDVEIAAIKKDKINILTPFIEIGHAVKDMPKAMWHLFIVYMFQWFGLKCYWDYRDLTIAKTIFNTTDTNAANPAYMDAVQLGGGLSTFTNIVTFVAALALIGFAKKHGARLVHALCLIALALAMFIFPNVHDKMLVYLPLFGYGLAWASIMGVPYLLIVNQIPKERYGVYMGLINMMIVIPMLIYSAIFGSIFKGILNSEPTNAIYFGGVLILIAAILTLVLFKNNNVVKPMEMVKP